jgi:hypothetical protein
MISYLDMLAYNAEECQLDDDEMREIEHLIRSAKEWARNAQR